MKEKKLTLFKKCTLLLVDDDKIQLDNIKVMMEFFFNKVLTASNGAEAITLFEQQPVDVVITDYAMPVMDGCALVKALREKDDELPVAIISSYYDAEKLHSVIDQRLSEYLVKPVEFNKIVELLMKIALRLEKYNRLQIPLAEGIYYDRPSKALIHPNEIVSLTKSESSLLELFISHKSTLISAEMIDIALGEDEPLSYHATTNIIYRLRKKIGKDLIKNVQSLGYIFVPETAGEKNR